MSPGRVPDVSPELPSLGWRFTLAVLKRLPQAALSRGLGHLADLPLPRSLRRPVLGAFARATGIDVGEAELPIDAYVSLNAFFVRRLRPGVRVFPDDPAVIVSPVDGVVGQHGRIREGCLIQAKGRTYDAGALLDDAHAAARYEGGSFLTIYLSPRHYHRIHSPVTGTVTSARHVPGALLPVNEPAVLHVPDLFPRNERVVCHIQGDAAGVAVVAVGAYNVGRISTAFDPAWVGPGAPVANSGGAVEAVRTYDPPVPVGRGDEIMAFHLGSTIVMLMEPGVELAVGAPGSDILLGAPVSAVQRSR